jgi:hypothetical protein
MNENHEQLIADYLAGNEVSSELLTELKAKPELLEDLAELKAVDRLLGLQAEDVFTAEVSKRLKLNVDEDFVSDVVEQLEDKRVKKSLPFIWLAAAACLLFVPLLFLPKTESRTVASISHVSGAKWSTGSSVKQGEIRQGQLKLTEGYAELAMGNGVTLLLEAPVELQFKSSNTVYVNEGKLVAKVPEDITEFSIETPTAEVESSNVEYGLSVSTNGRSEVHSFIGQVFVTSANIEGMTLLKQDEAGEFDEYLKMTKIMSKPGHFMRTLPGESTDSPDYLHWSFDDEEKITKCQGSGILGKTYAGELIGLRDGEGPKYGLGQYNKGLYFNGEDAYVETKFKGIGGNRPRTVAFWVKVPKDFNISNGYGIVSWGILEKGAAWQISPNPTKKDGLIGRLRIGTHEGMVIGTTDLRDDEWHHVAIVMYGGEHAEVSTHILMYIDGQLENTSKKSVAKIQTNLSDKNSRALMIGRNLGFTDKKNLPNKFFKGWLDELFIFDTALDDEQIRSLMNRNNLPFKGNL